jgi:hypothetical protein
LWPQVVVVEEQEQEEEEGGKGVGYEEAHLE